jgi:hypothetical protein
MAKPPLFPRFPAAYYVAPLMKHHHSNLSALPEPAAKLPAPRRATKSSAPAVHHTALVITAAPVLPVKTKRHHILAWADVGWGNSIYVRGGNGGLAWVVGSPMICVADDQWVWSYPADTCPEEVKLLRNDIDWALGGNTPVLHKRLLVLMPEFPEI